MRRRSSNRVSLILIGICLLAFGLRVYALDGQSMWSDEGLSYHRAQQPTAVVLANTITVDGVPTVDTNPPFYFLLLHGWRALLGQSIFSLRLMGVFAGLLAAPLMYVLGRALFWRHAGTLAALFLAVSPFHVWQTQVLRNYGLLITLNLFCIYGLVRYTAASPQAAGRGKWAALWLGAGLLGIYTHYFGFFVFAFTLVAFAASVASSWRMRDFMGRRLWLGLLLVAMLLPALWAAFDRFRAGRQFDFFAVNPWGVVAQAASVFSVGMSPTLTHPWSLVAPGLLLLFAGSLLGWWLRRSATLLLLGYQVIPLGLLLAMSTINPLFNGTRHLLIGLPPFLLLCAVLPAALWRRPAGGAVRRLGLFVGIVFIVIQVIWMQRQFHHPDFVRDDIRAAADYLNRMAQPEDQIVLHDTLIKFTFDAYYDGAAPVIAAPLFGRQDEEAAIARLQTAGERSRRVWFLTHPEPRTGFPRDLLWRWADENWRRLNTINFDWLWLPLRLRVYSVQPELVDLPSQASEQHAVYEDGLILHGLEMPASLQSGAPFAATFYLSREELEAPPAAASDYEISLRFQDEEGRLWQQVDQGLWPAYPPQAWPAATLLRYDHITQLAPGLPPGQYQVWMRILERQQNRPLAIVAGGVDLRLADVMVSAASCEQAQDPWPGYSPDDTFFGSSLLLRGHGEPAATYRPGHLLRLDLLWCVLRPPEEDYRVQARLTDDEGAVVAQAEGRLTRADYPVADWQADELLQGSVQLPVPATTAAGVYRLQIAVVPGDGGSALPVNLGLAGRAAAIEWITVEEWPLETVLPPIATPLQAAFGEPHLFELHGYELSPDTLTPGESATLTFYWRSAVDAPSVNYYAFVHVIQEGQAPEAQADGPPLNGFRPTSSWRAGEVFVDERTLIIPQDAAEGDYRLTVGFYNPDTGERLAAFVEGRRQEHDAVFLQPLSIAR